MRFEIVFHTPFRVATGRAGDGADSTVDRSVPLPASSLKGVMRSAARDLLCLPPGWVELVFGTSRAPSAWSWSDATPATGTAATTTTGTAATTGPAGFTTGLAGFTTGLGGAAVRQRARVRIDPDTSTAAEGALLFAEEVLAPRAHFTVVRTGWIPPALVAGQRTVLMAAARAVTALGADRRRGLGWVSVTPTDPLWTAELARRVADDLAGLPPHPAPEGAASGAGAQVSPGASPEGDLS